jgi:hypothetical protein
VTDFRLADTAVTLGEDGVYEFRDLVIFIFKKMENNLAYRKLKNRTNNMHPMPCMCCYSTQL